MDSFGFLKDDFYWLTLGVAFLAAFLWFTARQKVRLLQIWSFERPAHLSRCEFVTILFFITLGLAALRPYFGFEEVELPQQGRDLVVVFDVSQSMAAADLKPNRLTFGKRKLLDLIDLIQGSGNGDKLSLVLFAGSSYTFCPLTSDYSVLRTFAEAIELDLISAEGSHLNGALAQALRVLQEVNSSNGEILLITDGEDIDFNLENAALPLQENNVSVSVLGIGTGEGAPIPIGGGQYLKDDSRQIVISRLKDRLLQRVAELTGGDYRQARLGDSDLSALLSRINRGLTPPQGDSTTGEQTTIRSYNEVGPLLIVFALFLHLLGLLLRRNKGFVFWMALCLVPLSEGRAQVGLGDSASFRGKEAYSTGDFDTAEQLFRQELLRDPENERLLQGLASTLFQKEQYQKAQELFEQAAKYSTHGKDRFENTYNAGTSALFAREPKRAIPLLEQALEMKPGDSRTADNLKLAKLLLQQQEQPEQNQEKEKPNQENQSPEEPQKQENQQSKEQQKNESADSQPQEKEQQEEQSEQGENRGSASPTPTPSEDRSSEAPSQEEQEASENQTQQDPQSGDSTESETIPLTEAEAQAWLDSLADAPVLLQKQVGKADQRPGGQRW